MEQRTTLIPTMKRLQSLDEHVAIKLLDESEANICRLIVGAELGGNRNEIRAAKHLLYRHECRTREFMGPRRVDEAALIERAARAMEKHAKREGYMYQEPCKTLSTFDHDTQTLTLRNVNGVLATFRYNAKANRLTYVEAQS
jgi:hypothetical protein